jgi:GT2 family glycosyltransferase
VRASSGDWICILNNDTLLAAGWNRILQESADCHDLAAVMPMCYEGPFDYSLERAASLHEKSYGTDAILGAWNGVCMFVRRATFDKVGLFDERYQFGKYEDVDFVRRINFNGLCVATAKGALIHHFGSKTVEKVKSEVEIDFEKDNHRRFLMTFRRGRLDRIIMKWRDKKTDRCMDAFRKESEALIESVPVTTKVTRT